VLFNEPKLLKLSAPNASPTRRRVSVLFNEPKLLKSEDYRDLAKLRERFSALQRAEIAEIDLAKLRELEADFRFSALQRAEIAEMLGSAPEARRG